MRLILIFVAIIISALLANYVGILYDSVSVQSGSFFFGKNDAIYLAGFILSLIFTIPLALGFRDLKRNLGLIIWITLPLVLIVIASDKYHFYIPVILWLISTGFVYLLNKFQHKI